MYGWKVLCVKSVTQRNLKHRHRVPGFWCSIELLLQQSHKNGTKHLRPNKKTSVFPVARVHCILTTKLHVAFFFKWCVHKPLKHRKNMLQNDFFWPEHAEDISSVYLLNQTFESVSDLFAKERSKRIWPLPIQLFMCVYLPVLLIKKIAHCCFSIYKIKNKKTNQA